MVEATGPDAQTIKTQIEYYMSDINLSRDKFFREQIMTDKEGWVSIGHFLNCNKVKQMKITQQQIAESCADSDLLDVHSDKTKIRRKDNKALPDVVDRKRDQKAAEKLEAGKQKAAGAT